MVHPSQALGIRSLKALQVTVAIAQKRPRVRERSGLRGKPAFRWAGGDQHELELEGEISSQRKKFAGLSDRVPDHSRGFSTHYARVRDRFPTRPQGSHSPSTPIMRRAMLAKVDEQRRQELPSAQDCSITG